MHSFVGTHLIRTTSFPLKISHVEPHKALVIVETRPSFFFPHVVAGAISTHPGWHLYVFGTPEVHALLDSCCDNECKDYTKITLGSARMTSQQYSHLLMSSGFWDCILEEHVLVFQTDSVLVRPTPPRYLDYAYVGAVCGPVDDGASFIMNGGLSLRRRSAMQRAVHHIRHRHPALLDEPEDVAFCAVMRAYPAEFSLPSMRDCNEFAVESVGDASKAVGMHGTDKYYAPSQLIADLLVTRPPSGPART
jgi:hypothetical protein